MSAARSVAGIAGPIMVNAVADGQKVASRSGSDLHASSFPIMIELLVVALVRNEPIEPVDEKWHEHLERGRKAEVNAR